MDLQLVIITKLCDRETEFPFFAPNRAPSVQLTTQQSENLLGVTAFCKLEEL